MGIENKSSGRSRIAGIAAAYMLTFAGIIFGGPALFSASKSWFFVVFALVVLAPLFPAVQSIMIGERDGNLLTFIKIYAVEYASLVTQFAFLSVSAPFVIILVAGRLAIALLVSAGIAWIIVGLQQLGFNIGRKIFKN